MSTERLYYHDSYLTQFDAEVIRTAEDGRRVYLNRTAFYPSSGGQPFDTGQLGERRVIDVIDEDDEIVHVLDGPLDTAAVAGTIDWTRRFDHMQQHTGQHLLSAVFAEKAGLSTLSFHLGSEVSTIDLDTAAVDAALLESIEDAANEEIVRNHRVSVTLEDAGSVTGLRKASDRSGTLRVVTIEGLDRSACGGTHLASTGEIGSLRLLGTEKVRQSTRVKFVCGKRAVSLARQESKTLREQTASFSAKIGQLQKERAKLAVELANYRGRELYQQTEPSPDGLRRAVRRVVEIDEAVRAEAQAFTQCSRAVYIASTSSGLLLAVSSDSGWNAGAAIKPLVQRGGGTATLAQGSTSDPEAAVAALLG